MAQSGEEAVALLASGLRPHLILLDIAMPGWNGYQTLERLQELELEPEIPVIFLTGLTEAEEELKGRSSGAVDYITKPFVKEILLARLKIHLEQSRKSQLFDADKVDRLSQELTPTELAVAKLMAQGYTNAEIAQELHYSYNYVKKLSSIIFEKLDISRRNEIRDFLI